MRFWTLMDIFGHATQIRMERGCKMMNDKLTVKTLLKEKADLEIHLLKYVGEKTSGFYKKHGIPFSSVYCSIQPDGYITDIEFTLDFNKLTNE